MRRARRELWRRRLARASRQAGAAPQLCTDVLAWALARDSAAEWQQLLPARDRTLEPPRTVEPIVHEAYAARLTPHQHGTYLVRVDDADVIGRYGLVRLSDGKFAVESVYTPDYVRNNPDIGLARLRRAKRMSGTYVSLLGGWAWEGNYYHWIHDSVKRLCGALASLPPDTRFIVPSSLLDFQHEVLELIGIGRGQLVPFAPDDFWRVEHLYFVPPASNSGSHRADADTWLRDAMLAGSGVRLGPPRRRLYLSRGDAQWRRVTNEADVIDFLDGQGFEVCALISMTVRETIELFAQAEAVVSPHGASLTNIMFAPPGLRVLDVLAPQVVHNGYVYWTLSRELGHDYWYFEGPSASADLGADVTIPLDKLAATIERWGLGR